ncbi:uncharacterized protein LOC108674526 [Hyalella azteca]|uniref:Uncharacterized protein LOC108674526 n=1 Tax=Hyalella azteca TaxID=294128 RepID=A0A8B7NW75_HYAAZ|nr:uncharacterized protein LOC108674526 [Hyalella azteca]
MELSSTNSSNSDDILTQEHDEAITKFIDKLQEASRSQVDLLPDGAARDFIQLIETYWDSSTADAKKRDKTVRAVLFMMDVVLPKLSCATTEFDFLEAVLPLLQSTLSANMAELELLVQTEEVLDEAFYSLLLGCLAVVQNCQRLLTFTEGLSNATPHLCLPSFAPTLLLQLVHVPLEHCQTNGAWYEDRDMLVKEAYNELLAASLEAASVLLNSLSSICNLAACNITASMLMEVSSMCRLLSSLSHMKGVVNGWKNIASTCSSLKRSEDALAFLNDGLDVKFVVEKLSMELQEGLELLYSLLPHHHLHLQAEERASQQTVVRRVVRMCTMCAKVTSSVADTFLEHCGVAVVSSLLHFCLILARCSVCVTLLEAPAPQQEGQAVLGEGLSEPMVLALQLLLTTLTPHTSFGGVLLDAIASWITTAKDLEARYMSPERTAVDDEGDATAMKFTWGACCSAPLLLLCYVALGLPDAVTQQHKASSLSQLPCVLLASFLCYVPYCSGVLHSSLAVRLERRDGAAADVLPLYETTLVAASVVVTAVTDAAWPTAQRMLFSALLKQKKASSLSQLPCVLLASFLCYVPYCSGVLHSSLAVRLERRDGAAADVLPLYEATLVAASVVVTAVTDAAWPTAQRMLFSALLKQSMGADWPEVDPELRVPYSKLAELTGRGSVNCWWSSALAADLITFVARVGSGELCSDLYVFMCRAAAHAHADLQPSLALLLLRLQKCLPQSAPVTASWTSLPAVLQCHLSGTLLFSATKDRHGPDELRMSTACLKDVCDAASDALARAVTCGTEAAVSATRLRQLEDHLQCLFALLRWRTPGASDVCLGSLVASLAQFWDRISVKCLGCSGGIWLVMRLAMVTSRVTDLMDDLQVAQLLRVCLDATRKLSCMSVSEKTLVGEAVIEVWKSLSVRTFKQPLGYIADNLAELCCLLVSENQHAWLCQRAMEAFVFFAHRTPHKEIVAAILQRCSPAVKQRLQKFLMREPHAVPLKTPSMSALSHSGGAICGSQCMPFFLFRQQCVSNSRKISHVENIVSESSEVTNMLASNVQYSADQNLTEAQEYFSNDATENDSSYQAADKRRLSSEELDILASISKNISVCQNLIETFKLGEHSYLTEMHFEDALKHSEQMTLLLTAASAKPVKRRRNSVFES